MTERTKQLHELLKEINHQRDVMKIVIDDNDVSVQLKDNFDEYIATLGDTSYKYYTVHKDKNCHIVNVRKDGIRYFAVENLYEKYKHLTDSGHKWCYDCVNYVKGPDFCGYSEISCKIHGSLDVDQKERCTDITANTCKDYVQKDGERWWTKYYKEEFYSLPKKCRAGCECADALNACPDCKLIKSNCRLTALRNHGSTYGEIMKNKETDL